MAAGCYFHLALVTDRKPVLGLAVAQECKTRGGTARRRGARVAHSSEAWEFHGQRKKIIVNPRLNT